MKYETWVGWRYLFRHRSSMALRRALVFSLLLFGSGGVLLAMWGPSSSGASMLFFVGSAATVIVGLLNLFTVFTTVSMLGVVFGVAALTVVLAVTTGFQQEFRDKVLGVNAHVIIQKEIPFSDYRERQAEALEIDEGVVAAQPFIYVEMLATRGKGQISGVAIKGVDPEAVSSVLDLDKYMVEGNVASLGVERTEDQLASVIIGKQLAEKLKAKVGDELTVVSPLSNISFENMEQTSSAPMTQRFRITGVYYSGFAEYDTRLMYVRIEETQALMREPEYVMGVELRTKDVRRAPAIAEKLREKFQCGVYGNQPYRIQDWRQLNANLFSALGMQKLVLVIILTLIIVVAAVNMVSALTMMVTDKTREIAILKSMGSTDASVGSIFRVAGVWIGGVGTVIGLSLGLILCWLVSNYEYKLDPKVYVIDHLPVRVVASEVLLIAVITMLIAIGSVWVPSRRASKLRPTQGLRYE